MIPKQEFRDSIELTVYPQDETLSVRIRWAERL